MGEAKTAELKAALELWRRLAAAVPEERLLIKSARDVANLFLAEMGLLEQQSLRTLLLNTKNAVLITVEVACESVKTAQVRTAGMFREAVLRQRGRAHTGAQPPIRRPHPRRWMTSP